MMWLTIFLCSLIGLVPFVGIALAPTLISALCKPVGWYLRQKTAGRKEQIIERVDEDEKAFEITAGERSGGDEDWENVEAYTVGSAENGKKADAEWDGIVGFFHPFWCALYPLRLGMMLTLVVMLVEEENESSGLP
jgi:alpha-1,2-mannosyltransferase